MTDYNEFTSSSNIPEATSGSEIITEGTIIRFAGTGRSMDRVAQAKENILSILKSEYTFSVQDSFHEMGDTTYENDVRPFPMVVLIGGAGGNGKDTFISACAKATSTVNMSTVDIVKEAADVLIEASETIAEKMKAEKADKYRSFIADIKAAWTKYCDGPAIKMYNQIGDIVETALSDGELTNLIFINVREIEELNKMKNYIEGTMGLICLTMEVTGLVDPSAYTNIGDAESDQYTWDLIVKNTPGYPEIFQMQANLFGKLAEIANRRYGFYMNVDNELTSADTAVDNTIDNASITTNSTDGATLEFSTSNVSVIASDPEVHKNVPSPFPLDYDNTDDTTSD